MRLDPRPVSLLKPRVSAPTPRVGQQPHAVFRVFVGNWLRSYKNSLSEISTLTEGITTKNCKANTRAKRSTRTFQLPEFEDDFADTSPEVFYGENSRVI